MKANSTEEIVKPDYSNVKVGDYMLKDGTTIRYFEMTEEQEDQAIGVVAYLYEEHRNIFLKGGVKAALKAKGVEKPHGIVIALGNAGGEEKYEWNTGNPFEEIEIEYKSLNEQIFFGLDGVDISDCLIDIEDFPAFKAAKEYEKEVQAPKNTTGWYLPSIGEWFCLLNHYENFPENIGGWDKYWSSSEGDSNFVYEVDFYSEEKFIYGDNHTKEKNYVRPVLAF